MLLSDLSIKRPVFATMINVVLIIFGLFSLPKLAIDLYPDIDFPVVTVQVIYKGADPESIEQKILKPLEKELNGISGLKTMAANAYPNVAQLVLQFNLEKNSDEAAEQVRDRVFGAVGELPQEADTPIVRKFDIGGAPIVSIALYGDNIAINELSRIAKDVVEPALERIDGVASVSPAGLREREVQVHIDRERLLSFGLGPHHIEGAIRSQNLDVPSGKIIDEKNYYPIRVLGRASDAEELSMLPIANAKNANIRLSDVATVKETVADEESAAFNDNQPTILFSVHKQAGANSPTVASLIKEQIDIIKSSLPQGMSLQVVNDNSLFIKGSIDAVQFDLVLGAILAVIIVLIFLRDRRITLISAMALPTAVIATFAFMNLMGFTLNMMTTLALSLSIGILIDDAIIVVENIHRHLAMGKSGIAAARDATREIGLAVIATTMTLIAVFVPVAFMQGIIGRFFFQFGLTVAFAVLVSLFVAFTLTPMLSAKFLKHEQKRNILDPLFFDKFERVFSFIEILYKRLLQWCLHRRGLTLTLGFMIFVVSIFLLRFVPVSFFPIEDRSEFSVDYELKEGTSLSYTKEKSLVLAQAIKAYQGVKSVITSVGASQDKKPNKASLSVKLVDKTMRDYSQFDLMNRLREDLKTTFEKDGSTISVSMGDEGPKSQPIQFVFKSDNWEKLEEFSDDALLYTKDNIPGAVDVITTKPKNQEEYKVEVDVARAFDLGLSPAIIGSNLRALFAGEKVGAIDKNGRAIDIMLRIADDNRTEARDIASISIPTERGSQVSLSSVATLALGKSPSMIERLDGQRQISLLANFTGKDLNSAVNSITDYINEHKNPSITMVLSGQAEIMKDAISSMLQALLLAIILVFIVLCIQYESYSSPMVIMAALPLSLTGAFGALLLTAQIMSVYAMIGIILLMGLVTKNGILLIDFTLQRMREGISVKDALLEAGPLRLRPILMTTFAAGFGMLPVAIGHGIGGEARSPMGIAVIGGLLASTLLTLVVVPCLFSLTEELKARYSSKLNKKEANEALLKEV